MYRAGWRIRSVASGMIPSRAIVLCLSDLGNQYGAGVSGKKPEEGGAITRFMDIDDLSAAAKD